MSASIVQVRTEGRERKDKNKRERGRVEEEAERREKSEKGNAREPVGTDDRRETHRERRRRDEAVTASPGNHGEDANTGDGDR